MGGRAAPVVRPPWPQRKKKKMGFRPEDTVYKLEFEGTPYDGLIIRIGCCTVGEFNDIMPGDPMKGLKDNNEALFELFLKYLKTWNLEQKVLDENGKETGEWEDAPYTMGAIRRQESFVMSHIIAAWQRAMTGISPNLRRPSSGGGISEEFELDLASLSENQSN
jgi:hypothetical protein